jgi:ABC-type uncharacterized transport system ATPase component
MHLAKFVNSSVHEHQHKDVQRKTSSMLELRFHVVVLAMNSHTFRVIIPSNGAEKSLFLICSTDFDKEKHFKSGQGQTNLRQIL